jgi:hypothetical protein
VGSKREDTLAGTDPSLRQRADRIPSRSLTSELLIDGETGKVGGSEVSGSPTKSGVDSIFESAQTDTHPSIARSERDNLSSKGNVYRFKIGPAADYWNCAPNCLWESVSGPSL